jgi:hypothetical protein
MSKRRNSLLVAATSIVLAAGSMTLAAPAYAASDVGGLDISRFCRAALGSNWYATTTNPSDPSSWRCRTASGASLLVGVSGLHNTCRIQYGNSAVAVLTYYSAYGWRCYR